MISHLRGTIEFQGERSVVMDVHGVGYKVFCGTETLIKMPKKGEAVSLWTHTHIREDALDLYGFFHFSELQLFEMLIGISGVGPKTALGVLGVAPADTLRKAIAAGDTTYLTKVSGIGRKIAEKIILELKDKMAGRGMTAEHPELKEETDVLDALMTLGYSQSEARSALLQVSPETKSTEKKITEALKKLSTR